MLVFLNSYNLASYMGSIGSITMCGELEIVDQPGKEEGELSPFTRYNTNLRIDYPNSGNEEL